MARHNLGEAADLCRADALHPVTRDAVVLVDPARRRGGRRRFRPDDYQPGLREVMDCYGGSSGRDLVVKCAPGIDFEGVSRLGFDGEIEVTSYRGSVREACLWSAGLAGPGVRRRASILDSGEQITDAEPDDCPVRPAGRWIVDPDGAVVRAGLVRHYAARHGLWQLDPAHRLPVRRPAAAGDPRLRGARAAGVRRAPAAAGAVGARLRRAGDPGPRCRRRPRRAAAAAAAARQPSPVGGHHPCRRRRRPVTQRPTFAALRDSAPVRWRRSFLRGTSLLSTRTIRQCVF